MSKLPLAYLLLRASRWFDRQLLERLEARGWPRLSSAQSLVFPHLTTQGISSAALARALGVSRQSTHELIGGLQRLELVQSTEDPTSRRQRRLVLTSRGRALAADATRILTDLENELAQGGEDETDGVDTAALRRLLATPPFDVTAHPPAPPDRESDGSQ